MGSETILVSYLFWHRFHTGFILVSEIGFIPRFQTLRATLAAQHGFIPWFRVLWAPSFHCWFHTGFIPGRSKMVPSSFGHLRFMPGFGVVSDLGEIPWFHTVVSYWFHTRSLLEPVSDPIKKIRHIYYINRTRGPEHIRQTSPATVSPRGFWGARRIISDLCSFLCGFRVRFWVWTGPILEHFWGLKSKEKIMEILVA